MNSQQNNDFKQLFFLSCFMIWKYGKNSTKVVYDEIWISFC